MRRWLVAALLVVGIASLGVLLPQGRNGLRVVLRPEPPAPITALPLMTAAPPATQPPRLPTQTARTPTVIAAAPTATARQPTLPPASPTATTLPTASPTPGPVTIDGRVYTAYTPAMSKAQQFFRYSCEFDAAWVILATYGIDAPFEEMLAAIGSDDRVEPYLEETADGFLIHGGDIGSSFSGDYTDNFLARSTGTAFRKVFARYGLEAEPVHDRASVEAALRAGALVWMKTTVDFKPWRPATWITPEGVNYSTVVGNDHAVVAIGFNQDVVVIRDVLGPTSSNMQRPYEYEVSWDTFLASWGAQSNDGLAVYPPIIAP